MKYSLLLIILLASLLQLLIIGQNIANGITLSNTLDLSWQTDIIERYLHGYIAGRDFIFTYGPLSQLIFTLPALILNQKSYISILYIPVIISLLNTLLIYFISKQLFKDNIKGIFLSAFLLFFVGLLFYDSNNLLRSLIPFAFSILAYKFIDFNNIFRFKNIAIFSLPTFSGLYTYDLFILCILITILLYILNAYNTGVKNIRLQHISKLTINTLIAVLMIFLFEILISIFLSGNLNYIIYSFDTMSNYQFIENIPFSINYNLIYIIYPVALMLLLTYLHKYSKINKKTKNIILMLSITALLQIKSALIRSDDSHIIMGIYPSLIICFIIIFLLLLEKFKWKILIVFIALYMLIPVKNNYFRIMNISYLQSSINLLMNNKSFFTIYKTPSSFPYSKKDFSIFEKIINNNPNKVMIYPYDNYILNIFDVTFNTLPLQYYQYSGTVVELDSIKLLKQTPPEYIILGIDTKGAVMLDNIPNFSRNPLTAKWMLENYSVYRKTGKYLILQKNKNKNPVNKITNNKCSIYDVDVSGIMKTNILESLTKTTTYYLYNYETRLPYTATTKQILIIENHTDSDTLAELFKSKINFDNYRTESKKLKIIKKHPIPVFKGIFKMDYNIKCYN